MIITIVNINININFILYKSILFKLNVNIKTIKPIYYEILLRRINKYNNIYYYINLYCI